MKNISMKKNVIMNGIRTFLSLLFPLVTFPYATRVLTPSGIGQANYSNSIANYFVILGSLGIASYAIREGAKLRHDEQKLTTFVNEIWSVSWGAMLFAYLCLAVTLLFCDKLVPYRLLIIIYALHIFSNVWGMEWIVNIYEDYQYVTLWSFFFHIVTLILLFVFVNGSEDVLWYVCIQMIYIVGLGITSHWYVSKKYRLSFVWNKQIVSHFLPILLIFATTLATMIYVNLDISMLGWIWDDEQVGFYSVAAKLYNMVKACINSIVTVYVVRLSRVFISDKKGYQKLFNDAFYLISGLTIPIAIGGFFFRKEIILLLGGEAYLQGSNCMAILLLSLFFATLGNLFASGVLLVVNKEKYMLFATVIGAIVNMVLNYFFIHGLKCTGAAFATCITEIVVCYILLVHAHSFLNKSGWGKHCCKTIVSCALFGPIYWWINVFPNLFYVSFATKIVLCVISFAAGMLILRDELAIRLFRLFKDKITGRNMHNDI